MTKFDQAISDNRKMDDESANRALLNAGFHHKMSILSGFQGPGDHLFQGTIYEYVYKFNTYLSLALRVYIAIQFLLTFVLVPYNLFLYVFVLMCASSMYLSIAQTVYMEFNRPLFVRLLKMNEDATNDEYDGDELEVEKKIWAGRAYKLQFCLYFVLTAPILPWAMSATINEILGNPWGPRRISIEHWVYYDIQKTHLWVLTQVMQTLAGTYLTLTTVMFNGVFFCLSFRILALLCHLKKTIKNIFQVINVNSDGNVWYTNYRGETVHREDIEDQLTLRLKTWISHHQQVMKSLKELQSLYSFPLFLNFCHAGTALASGAAAVSKGNLLRFELAFIALYLMGILFTLFVVCRIGDHLKIETSEILDNTVGQNYFMLSKSQRTLLKTLFIGTNEPFVFTVVHTFPLNTETFKSIVMTTYSFYTVFSAY